MNLQAYAAHRKAKGLRGTSHVAVLQAIQAGRLTDPAVQKIAGKWVIDPTLADLQWASNTQSRVTQDTPKEIVTEKLMKAGPTMAEAQRAKVVYQAERERLEVMRLKGELVSAAEVKTSAFMEARRARDALMTLPDRLAAQVAGTSDIRQCHTIITEEIRVICRTIADLSDV